LDEEQKNVFLDIACVFKGHQDDYVQEVLHDHYGYCIKSHIGLLVNKSLMKISVYGTVTLHDLIEDMGKEIVRQESIREPGERSRLWCHDDIVHVLKGKHSKIDIYEQFVILAYHDFPLFGLIYDHHILLLFTLNYMYMFQLCKLFVSCLINFFFFFKRELVKLK